MQRLIAKFTGKLLSHNLRSPRTQAFHCCEKAGVEKPGYEEAKLTSPGGDYVVWELGCHINMLAVARQTNDCWPRNALRQTGNLGCWFGFNTIHPIVPV